MKSILLFWFSLCVFTEATSSNIYHSIVEVDDVVFIVDHFKQKAINIKEIPTQEGYTAECIVFLCGKGIETEICGEADCAKALVCHATEVVTLLGVIEQIEQVAIVGNGEWRTAGIREYDGIIEDVTHSSPQELTAQGVFFSKK